MFNSLFGAELEKLFEIALAGEDNKALQAEILAIKNGTDSIVLPEELLKEGEEADEQKTANLAALIKEMTIPQKIKLALFGSQSARAILLRDTNRQIPLFVLQNARLTDMEIAEIAKNSNMDENVLRGVGTNATWMKNYAVKYALVANTRTPIDIALRWLKYIQDKDLRRLSKSKNVAQVIASQARKLVEQRKPGEE